MHDLTELMNRWRNGTLPIKEVETLVNLLIIDNDRLEDEVQKPEANGSPEFTGCVKKPPLGLRPWRIAREMRAKEITDAMQRYWEAEKLMPKEWFDELKHLVG